jgi:hypothetical protein
MALGLFIGIVIILIARWIMTSSKLTDEDRYYYEKSDWFKTSEDYYNEESGNHY